MQWSVKWFQWQEDKWRHRLNDVEDGERPPELDCYCHKQMVLWKLLADQAQTQFSAAFGRPLFW
jgi:hypothetical protein